jgi:hypothetical protein
MWEDTNVSEGHAASIFSMNYPNTSPHGVITQKTTILVLIALTVLSFRLFFPRFPVGV